MLTERHLTSAEEEACPEEPQGVGGMWLHFRFHIGLDASQHQATKTALKELVGDPDKEKHIQSYWDALEKLMRMSLASSWLR